MLLVCAAPPSAAAATDDTLLRRHAPVLVLDAREADPPVVVGPFLRGARGARARAAPPRAYGHAVRDGGRLWLQYWFFYPDNPQDRGILRSGRHEGDWEMLQVGLGAGEPPSARPGARAGRRGGAPPSSPAPSARAFRKTGAGARPRRGTRMRAPARMGPPGHPWWAFAALGALLGLFAGWFLRRRASRA